MSEAEARIYSSVGAVQRDSHEHIDETGDDDEGSDADGENTEDRQRRTTEPGDVVLARAAVEMMLRWSECRLVAAAVSVWRSGGGVQYTGSRNRRS